ncbi:MAG: polysaccharide deacetylase family protein [Clostridia bacterium]
MKKKHLLTLITNTMIALIIITVFSYAFVSGSIFVSASTVGDPIYQGNTEKRQISLMINVYWGTEYIKPMLDVLAEKNAKATFFVGGSWVAKNDAVLKQIYDSGNEIGSHGFNHRDQNKISLELNRQEILTTHNLVKETIGLEMNLFAPPSGAFNKNTLLAAYELGYKTIMWTRDTIDWRDRNEDTIFSRAIKNPQNGDLILMHPIKETLGALPRIIDYLKSLGFSFVTVTQNLAE